MNEPSVRLNSGSKSRSGTATRQRKCGHCHQPGHTRKNCPNGGKDGAIPQKRNKNFGTKKNKYRSNNSRSFAAGEDEFDDDDDLV